MATAEFSKFSGILSTAQVVVMVVQRRAWQPTPVFLLGESGGQRSLAGYRSRGHKESNTTEQLALLVYHFQINDDIVKVLHSICQQIWKTQQWPQDRKRSVFIPISKKGSAKECSNYCTIALISHARKAMLTILQARVQQYMNGELPNVQAVSRKDTEIKLLTSVGS